MLQKTMISLFQNLNQFSLIENQACRNVLRSVDSPLIKQIGMSFTSVESIINSTQKIFSRESLNDV
mgnify:CR=1 FL=1